MARTLLVTVAELLIAFSSFSCSSQKKSNQFVLDELQARTNGVNPGQQCVSSLEGSFSKISQSPPFTFLIDEGSESASFSLLWDNAAAGASATLLDPAGNTHRTQPIPQGLYVRIDNPVTGEWRMRIDPRGADSRFVASAYVLNRVNRLVVSTRWPTRKPGEEIYVFAFPKSKGGSITLPGAKLTARVTRPDGSTDTLELTDNGRDAPNHGDDIAGDGIFTGVYKNTGLKGTYGFQVSATFDKWQLSSDAHVQGSKVESPRFMREARVSAKVE